jgi:hypothetical protein
VSFYCLRQSCRTIAILDCHRIVGLYTDQNRVPLAPSLWWVSCKERDRIPHQGANFHSSLVHYLSPRHRKIRTKCLGGAHRVPTRHDIGQSVCTTSPVVLWPTTPGAGRRNDLLTHNTTFLPKNLLPHGEKASMNRPIATKKTAHAVTTGYVTETGLNRPKKSDKLSVRHDLLFILSNDNLPLCFLVRYSIRLLYDSGMHEKKSRVRTISVHGRKNPPTRRL